MKHLFFLLLLNLTFSGWAQRYSFVEYNTAQGLPQSQVTSICQDSSGYMWIGTLGGLAKFNGIQFTTFTNDDGLFNNKISLVQYENKTLWIGHEGGLSKLQKDKFIHWPLRKEASNVQVSAILPFQNDLIVATNGDGLYRLKGDQLLPISRNFPGGDRIRDIVKFNNIYYVATRDGLFSTKDFQSFHLIPDSEYWSLADIQIIDGELFLAAYGDGLIRFNPRTGIIRSEELPIDFSPKSVTQTSEGKIWLCSNQGVLVKENRKWKTINGSNGLPLLDIKNIFEDDENNIWFESLGKGLLYFPGDLFVHFNTNSGMTSDLVLNVSEKGNNHFFIGTYDQGLLRYWGKFSNFHTENSTIWTSALDISQSDWFGTETGLLEINSKGKQKTWTTENGLLSNKVSCLYRVNSESMYIGGSKGLQLFKSGKLITKHENKTKDIGTIRNMRSFNGKLYIASDKGFYELTPLGPKLISNFNRTTFSLASNGKVLWLGTEEGLFKFDGEKISNVSYTDIPSGKFINFLNYRDGRLYIGSNNGLYILFEKRNKIQIEHYGIQEGVINLETNLNSGFVDSRGNFWFGTASGLVRMRKNLPKTQSKPPRVILEQVLLNYQPFNFSENLENITEIPSSKNNISFAFDGISLSNPESMRFQYWLEGADENWSPPTTNANVVFTSLSPGNYILHARTIGLDGTTSKSIILPFDILPPFYRTWWFFVAVSILIAFVIWRIVKIRINRERELNEKEKMQFRSRLLALEQQSLNASMNRHFIFNSLNSIQYFINTQDKLSANRFLTNFAQLIRKNLDSAGHDGNMIPLSKEIERLKLYLSLEAMRFKDKFSYEFQIEPQDLDGIYLPAMLLQPFVENSIIHGILPNQNQKGVIMISIQERNNCLEIKIEDNGIGISNSLKQKESFMGDHKSQGMEITAKRIELIKKISNQAFEIVGPIDRINEDSKINGTYVLLKIPLNILDNLD